MNAKSTKKLLLCYIDGMDLRRVDQTSTPFIFNILKSYPWVKVNSPPGADSLPTLLTGTYPSEHGMFGVKLKPNSSRSLITRFIDQMPDILTTTTQCIFQFLSSSYDLPAIPPKRRRHFEILRTLHIKKYKKTENLLQFGGVKSCLGVVGLQGCRYLYSRTSNPLQELIKKVGTGEYILEIVQLYSFDLLQRWNVDRVEKTQKIYRCFDNFVRSLYEKCKNNKITLLLFSDHGYDLIKGYIDLIQELKKLELSEEEYAYFIELSMARFWFHTERARSKITEMLRGLENTSYFSFLDLHKYNLSFPDSQYGEAFSMTHPGYIFFPNDFYHPLANLYLGLIDTKQRSRLFNPRHRGDHALLPQFDSAKGFMILLDKSYRTTKQEINPIDIAPSLLDMLGYDKLSSMKGLPVFHA